MKETRGNNAKISSGKTMRRRRSWKDESNNGRRRKSYRNAWNW